MSIHPTKEIAPVKIHCIYCKKELADSVSRYELENQVHLSCQAEIEIYKESRGNLPTAVFKEFQAFFKKNNIVQYQYVTNKELFHLKVLNLNDKNILSVPKSIHYLTNLKKLGLGGNGLQELPEELGWMTQLEMINLSCNNFTEVPTVLTSLSSLKKLMYAGNNIREYPALLKDLTALEVLDMSNNKLETIPEDIKELRTLTTLYSRYNRIEKVPDGVKHLSNLKTLDLAHNKIREIPNWIQQKHYTHLDLTNNPIDNIELKLQRLRSLVLHGVVLHNK